MQTFGQLKTAIRARVFPDGEASNLVASHNKDFIDAIIDLQTWVVCLQTDNTDLFPQCSTLYECGLTVFTAPRGIIRKLSIIDKIDPTTGEESADAADDYCSEVAYLEVDMCHVRRFLDYSQSCGYCVPIGLWFGLGFPSYRAYPTATDADVPAGLPILPLGYHYPQASTDRTWGRAGGGIWAKERGKIYVAPWIQSTETILVKWDGIKRTWNDADPIDDDPLFEQAIEEYLRWQHAAKWDRDDAAAASASAAFNNARAMLIHQCREETRVRSCEPSHARASAISYATLYYNDAQSFTASCPDGETGPSVTVTISAGTVGSNISVADANIKAKAEAQLQAEAQLVCSETETTYWNAVAGQYTAECDREDGAPIPIGDPVTVTIPVGSVSSTISQAAANAAAQSQAESQARAQRSCTYGNSPQTAIASCPDGTVGSDVTVTIPANTYQSTISQADANSQALIAAQNQAAEEVVLGCTGVPPVFYNTEQTAQKMVAALCPNPLGGYTPGNVTVIVTVPALAFASALNQSTANGMAQMAGIMFAEQVANARAAAHQCGLYQTTYPNP